MGKSREAAYLCENIVGKRAAGYFELGLHFYPFSVCDQ